MNNKLRVSFETIENKFKSFKLVIEVMTEEDARIIERILMDDAFTSQAFADLLTQIRKSKGE
jgi:hypothetical protein